MFMVMTAITSNNANFNTRLIKKLASLNTLKRTIFRMFLRNVDIFPPECMALLVVVATMQLCNV